MRSAQRTKSQLLGFSSIERRQADGGQRSLTDTTQMQNGPAAFATGPSFIPTTTKARALQEASNGSAADNRAIPPASPRSSRPPTASLTRTPWKRVYSLH